MRAAIYTRVSQDSRGDARSVGEQETACRAWVEREGWDLDRVYCDNDVSASKYTKKARPEWQALTERVAAGEVDVLVVWEPSRATRDRRVWAALAASCETRNVRFGVNGRLYDLDDPDDAFQLDLFFALATRESGTTRKRVQRAVAGNAAAGRPHGKLLYGYSRTYRQGRGGPELVAQVINDEQAVIVREVAARVMRGETLLSVAKDLNGRGLLAPRGGRWDATQVRRLCLNPGYVAKRVHRGEVVGDALWPPILDEVTHYSCVTRLGDPARRTTVGRGVRHLLSGLARCGSCDQPMKLQKNRGHYAYTCPIFEVSRNQEPVDDFVERLVIARLERADALPSMAPASQNDGAAAARGEAAEKRARLEGFYDAAAAGQVTPAALARIESQLLPEIAAADKRGRGSLASPLLGDVAGPAAAQAWAGLTMPQRREVVMALCKVRIMAVGRGRRIFDPDSIRIEWRGGSE